MKNTNNSFCRGYYCAVDDMLMHISSIDGIVIENDIERLMTAKELRTKFFQWLIDLRPPNETQESHS